MSKNKPLGISYNKWHGVIGFFIQVVGIPSSYLWLKVDSLQLQYIVALALSTNVNMLLQLWNEWLQLTSKNVLDNYVSYPKSIANSRDDMKWWLLGTIGGTIVGTYIFLLIDKI